MKRFSQLAVPYIVWTVIMLLLPMLLIVLYAFTDTGNEIMTFRFTLANFAKFFTDPDFLLVLWRSIKIALKTKPYHLPGTYRRRNRDVPELFPLVYIRYMHLNLGNCLH